MRTHCDIGYNMLVRIPFLREAAEIVLSHQEYYDGSGYPRGLRGEEIPSGGAHFRHRRRRGRHDFGPALPKGAPHRARPQRGHALQRHAVRPESRRGVPLPSRIASGSNCAKTPRRPSISRLPASSFESMVESFPVSLRKLAAELYYFRPKVPEERNGAWHWFPSRRHRRQAIATASTAATNWPACATRTQAKATARAAPKSTSNLIEGLAFRSRLLRKSPQAVARPSRIR